jgi:crotonobetainyl-CoA:carnitine CoA-transferase CaiB-like acyl-CoA transferase
MQMPLDGLTVVERLSVRTPTITSRAVRFASRLLVDMGSRVLSLKTELTDDDNEDEKEEEGTRFFLDRGKTSLLGRLEKSEGVHVLFTDCASNDDTANFPCVVQVEAFPSELCGAEPSEIGVLALSGLLDIIGEPEREPLMIGGHQAAYAAGMAAFAAAMSGIAATKLQQAKEFYTVGCLDVLSWVNWKAVAALELGTQPVRREGERAEWQVVSCADGYMAIVYEARDWPGLAAMIGTPTMARLIAAPRKTKLDNFNEYMSEIRGWCAPRTRAEIYTEAKARRIPFGPVFNLDELVSDPTFASDNYLSTFATAGNRTVCVPNLPLKWNNKRCFVKEAKS